MPAKPFIRDSSGLLGRVPELEEIAEEDRRVLAAIESGEPHAVFSALRWGLLLGRIRKHATTAKELLANRRLFLLPSRGRLWLNTLNGIGATFYGEGEPDFVDGSYIATHYLTFFFVPVFPLGQYLVRRAALQGGRAGYLVLGRLPFGVLLHLWSRLFTLLIFAGFVATLGSLLRSAGHNDFYVINEIGAPIEARIAGQVLKVASGGYEKAQLPTGEHEIAIYLSGEQKLESGRVQIRPGQKIIAWNVLGAAAIVQESIEYRRNPASQPPSPPRIHCGDRTIVYRNIDYAFSDPPKSLRTSGGSETRTHLFVAKPGVSSCLRYLQDKARPHDAGVIAVGHAQASGFVATALEEDIDLLLRIGENDSALRLAGQGRAANLGSLAHHRIYQNTLEAVGQAQKVRDEYAQLAQPELSAADLAYLSARLLPFGPERLARAAELATRNGDHALTLAWAASVFCSAGEFDRAVPLWDRLRTLDRERYLGELFEVATALVGAKQSARALTRLAEDFDGDLGEKPMDRQIMLASLYASVAQKVVKADPETLIRRLSGEHPSELRGFSRMLAGLPPPQGISNLSDGFLAAWQAQYGAMKDAAQIAELDPKVAGQLPSRVLLLFFAEAVRQNCANLAALHSAAAQQLPQSLLDRAARYIEQGGELEAYDSQGRATLLFVRSRVPGLPAAERQALRDEAKRLAVLPSVLTYAMDAWSAAEKTP